MHHYTYHVVWAFLTAGGISAVAGGPIWAYPVVVMLAALMAVFLVSYPTDQSLRRILTGFAWLLLLGTSSNLVLQGITPVTLHLFSPGLMCGIAMLWAVAFPLCESAE